ncbi:hypothetical protein F5Y14DRAFT_452953 [Nemania sp. NC0429]|nr:hypothetical protein F5Y14DRAFT_452953 [Nemania sp. NC0429]
MRPSNSPLATLLALITLLPAGISPVGAVAISDASLFTSQQEPEAQSVLVDDPAVAVASHDYEAVKIPVNQSDAIVITESTDNEKRDTKPKSKKKKPPKVKGNHTSDDDDDDDSGVGRGITLPTTLVVGVVLLVGALQI